MPVFSGHRHIRRFPVKTHVFACINLKLEMLVAQIVKRGLDLTFLSKAIGWHASVWRTKFATLSGMIHN